MRTPYTSCPLCGGVSSLFRIGDASKAPHHHPDLPTAIHWMRCSTCEHVHTDGYWNEEAMQNIILKTQPAQALGADLEMSRFVAAKMIDHLLCASTRLTPAETPQHTPIWMDVGVGNGALLFTAAEYGYRPVGIDIRPDVLLSLLEIGIPAYPPERMLEVDKLGNAVHVVSLCDVIEHVPFPAEMLKEIRSLMATGSVLLVSTPNRDAPLASALDNSDADPYWHEPEHFHYFSRDRLYQLLRNCGFHPFRYGVSDRYRCCMEVIAYA